MHGARIGTARAATAPEGGQQRSVNHELRHGEREVARLPVVGEDQRDGLVLEQLRVTRAAQRVEKVTVVADARQAENQWLDLNRGLVSSKASSDVYGFCAGEFVGVNAALQENIALISKKPYADGWLYEARGTLDDKCIDAEGYAAILNQTIDKMLEQQEAQKGTDIE